MQTNTNKYKYKQIYTKFACYPVFLKTFAVNEYSYSYHKILPEGKIKIWGALEKFSRTYYNLLRSRKKEYEENQNLKHQNKELREMLALYSTEEKASI